MFKATALALFAASASAASLQNLLNFEFTQAALDKFRPIQNNLVDYYNTLNKDAESVAIKNQFMQIVTELGPEVLAKITKHQEVNDLITDGTAAMNFYNTKITPYGLNGFHMDNKDIYLLTETIAKYADTVKRVSENKAIHADVLAYQTNP